MDVSLKHTEQGGRATRLRSRGRGWGDRARGSGGTRCDPNPCFLGACCLALYCLHTTDSECFEYGGLPRRWDALRPEPVYYFGIGGPGDTGRAYRGCTEPRSGKQPPCRTPSPVPGPRAGVDHWRRWAAGTTARPPSRERALRPGSVGRRGRSRSEGACGGVCASNRNPRQE
jgi:hypothetical protein